MITKAFPDLLLKVRAFDKKLDPTLDPDDTHKWKLGSFLSSPILTRVPVTLLSDPGDRLFIQCPDLGQPGNTKRRKRASDLTTWTGSQRVKSHFLYFCLLFQRTLENLRKSYKKLESHLKKYWKVMKSIEKQWKSMDKIKKHWKALKGTQKALIKHLEALKNIIKSSNKN